MKLSRWIRRKPARSLPEQLPPGGDNQAAAFDWPEETRVERMSRISTTFLNKKVHTVGHGTGHIKTTLQSAKKAARKVASAVCFCPASPPPPPTQNDCAAFAASVRPTSVDAGRPADIWGSFWVPSSRGRGAGYAILPSSPPPSPSSSASSASTSTASPSPSPSVSSSAFRPSSSARLAANQAHRFQRPPVRPRVDHAPRPVGSESAQVSGTVIPLPVWHPCPGFDMTGRVQAIYGPDIDVDREPSNIWQGIRASSAQAGTGADSESFLSRLVRGTRRKTGEQEAEGLGRQEDDRSVRGEQENSWWEEHGVEEPEVHPIDSFEDSEAEGEDRDEFLLAARIRARSKLTKLFGRDVCYDQITDRRTGIGRAAGGHQDLSD